MAGTPDTSWAVKAGSRGYVTVRAFDWWIGKENSGWVLTVPAGREFESSVPRLFRWFFSPDDPYFLKAAATHDMLLESGYRQAFADSQWFEAALSDHAPPFKTWLAFYWIGVRRFLIRCLGGSGGAAP